LFMLREKRRNEGPKVWHWRFIENAFYDEKCQYFLLQCET
jgi:hypothetical protein